MSYQDTLDAGGNVIRRGTRDCEGRWSAIFDQIIIEQLGTDFRALDLGAYHGYFSQRLATQFRADVVAVDGYRPLQTTMASFPSVTVIPERVTAAQLDSLGDFDLGLALSVLHHMPDWREVLDVLIERCHVLFIEVPHRTETLPLAVAHCDELIEAVEALDGEPIAETAGHRSEIPRTLWVV